MAIGGGVILSLREAYISGLSLLLSLELLKKFVVVGGWWVVVVVVVVETYFRGILVTLVQPSRHNDFFCQSSKMRILYLKHYKLFNVQLLGRKQSLGKLN